MRRVLSPKIFLRIAAMIATGAAAHAASAGERPAVVELFTSQSCSSCPPADRLLGKLAQRDDIIALSYAVPYWDYLGWRDTLALPENAKRQRAYAERSWHGEVYTPQVVVNGLAHCVGSNLPAIESAITKTRPMVEDAAVEVELEKQGDQIHVEAGAAPAGSKFRSGRVLVIAASESVAVPIKRGENAGRDVTYYNVVRRIAEAGSWKGEAKSFDLPMGSVKPKDADFIIVLLQDDASGAILGAAKLQSSKAGKTRT